jgi:hypothetical protein
MKAADGLIGVEAWELHHPTFTYRRMKAFLPKDFECFCIEGDFRERLLKILNVIWVLKYPALKPIHPMKPSC